MPKSSRHAFIITSAGGKNFQKMGKYNRALAEAVKQGMGVAAAELMKDYNLECLGGASVTDTFKEKRSCAKRVQQLNFGQSQQLMQVRQLNKSLGMSKCSS